MAWVRLDDGVYCHPKLGRVPKAARWAWVAGLAYANRYLTDGHIPTGALSAIDATRGDARHLVTAGLWEKVDGGWQVHDYDEYQPTKAQVESDRAAARSRMARRRRNGRGEFA